MGRLYIHYWIISFLVVTLKALNHQSAQSYLIAEQPTVHILNGSVTGIRLESLAQDAFLGIPYAKPPIGNLRFRHPQSLDHKWDGILQATKYGHTCTQYSSITDISEDCLTLNVFRPSNVTLQAKLPVFVIIYGGGFYAGSTSQEGYNPSALIALSQKLAQPILAVSMNYRLGLWGFLSTPEILAENSANAGLIDQRLAFQWIQENIAAFGGDPTRVTLWGVSAGAQSIGLHLHSYGGKNDGLYHRVIMESGGPVGTALQELKFYKEPWEELLKLHGCEKARDRLECMRSISEKELVGKKTKSLWNPIVDGKFLIDYPSILAKSGEFIRLPIITGANSEEGHNFASRTVNSDAEIATWLSKWRDYELKPDSIAKLIKLYEPYTWPPYSMNKNVRIPGTGRSYRKSGAIGGDMVMIAQRRKVAQQWTRAGQDVWSFRFDTPLWDSKESDGTRHSDEMVFTFQNVTGQLGPSPQFKHYQRLSEGMGEAYVNFVNRGDPNPPRDRQAEKLILPRWLSYRERPENMVFNAKNIHTEADDWREEGIAVINSISREMLS